MPDEELRQTESALCRIPRFQARAARCIRAAFDQIYFGQKTGRYRVDQLYKTEKAHIGSIVEIEFRREFEGLWADGQEMDYSIGGIDLDCKFSLREDGWMVPSEARVRWLDWQTTSSLLGFSNPSDIPPILIIFLAPF